MEKLYDRDSNYRQVTVTETGITFGSAYYTAGGATNNNYCIPTNIWGV